VTYSRGWRSVTGQRQPTAGEIPSPNPPATTSQYRGGERLPELDGHDVVKDRIDDRADVVQDAGDEEEDQITDALDGLFRGGLRGRRRVAGIIVGCSVSGGGTVGVRRHESLGVERRPTDEERHDDSN